MSQHERQQELLLQLKVENQQLLKFKKLNNLMRNTLETFVLKNPQQTPFAPLFTLLKQELQADEQLIVAVHAEDSFSVIEASNSKLKVIPEQAIHYPVFSEATVFFDLTVSPKWPEVFKQLAPDAKAALIQPVSIGLHHYAIVLLSYTAKAFTIETKAVVASYSNFIASLLSLFENQRLAQERDQLFAQQKRIEQSMVKQDKLAAIGQLAAGVAHELNNPLGFIYSNLNTLKVYLQTVDHFIKQACTEAPSLQAAAKAAELDFVINDSVDLIEESLAGARKSRDIIANLRTFSHPDDISVSTINLLELVESTIRIANTQIKRQTKLTLIKQVEAAVVNGNPVQLSQVLLNLINNAYQAIKHAEGMIKIVVARQGSWLRVEVTDNGSGISDTALNHIFEPFFTTKEVGEGTGLGLSISRAIAQQHNGSLTLEHTSADGSTFVLSLPVQDSANNA